MKQNEKKNILPPQIRTMIKQPNRVTSARYDYNLSQERVLLYIIKSLQEPMDELLKDRTKTLNQLELFKKDYIDVVIPLKSVCKNPSEYKELIETIKQLRKIDVVFDKKGNDDINRTVVTGLIVEASISDQKYRSEITISMNKDVAKNLVSIEGGYTRFAYEVAFNAKSKYTPKIYKLISRWRDKGGFTCSLEEFRAWLFLGDKYKNYYELERNVLKPAHDELYKKADVWFEVSKVMDGRTVKSLSFKIINDESLMADQKKKDNCIHMLKMHFNINSELIEQLQPILSKPYLINDFNGKLQELHSYVNKNKVENVPAYIVASLKNYFKNRI